jgi:hypothetical protein
LCENPAIFNIGLSLFVLMMVSGNAWALDPFEGIKCGADMAKSLIGKHDSNELEERHKNLGLKDLRATEVF